MNNRHERRKQASQKRTRLRAVPGVDIDAETAAIANRLKAELPESRGFLLVTFDRLTEGGRLGWASRRIGEDEIVRLLHEMVGVFEERAGVYGEPSAKTATQIREKVALLLRDHVPAGEAPPDPAEIWEYFNRARRGELPVERRPSAFLAMATAACIELEHHLRQHKRPPDPSDMPDALSALMQVDLEELAARELAIDEAYSVPQAERGDTYTALVADLETLPLDDPKDQLNRDQLIELAKKGAFHDYDSEIAIPKLLLITMCESYNFAAIAARARAGYYGGERMTTEQVEEQRQDFGPELFDRMEQLFGGKPRGVN